MDTIESIYILSKKPASEYKTWLHDFLKKYPELESSRKPLTRTESTLVALALPLLDLRAVASSLMHCEAIMKSRESKEYIKKENDKILANTRHKIDRFKEKK